MSRYFVTAIGTDSGKTLVSAILTEALQADYWKPIQAGEPRDTETVERLISNKKSQFHPERYLLNTPASPHMAARIDGVEIDPTSLILPKTENHLIIEGAGGMLVPLNENDVVIDLAKYFQCEIILVSNLYLGSINHTLLSIEALVSRRLPVKGIIFNGPENSDSESIILAKSGYKLLHTIRPLDDVNPSVIRNLATELRAKINE